MSDKMFRLSLIVLLAIFVARSLTIGYRFAEQAAQNGRYTQFDLQKASRPEGWATVQQYESWAIDTRTGQIVVVSDPCGGR
ncbi:MAG TPA: hypothetical protein VGR35_01145 [Tepidisphaeraceae bacterium]|nr:hypothetical protein [Tepidisphaeraceae bacterium]